MKDNQNASPLVDQEFLLEKFPGKGGWTYARIPQVMQNPDNPFGWVKVKGWVDSYELKNYKLMPWGEGKLFLPVKSEIRKKIGKQAGDYVRVILFADDTPLEIPEEFMDCLKDNPTALKYFLTFSEGEQKAFIDWIFSAKTDETKVDRIARSLERIEKGKKFADK